MLRQMEALTLGEKIREIREMKRLSLRELARRTDVSVSLISAVELGNRYPSQLVLESIAGELEVSVSELENVDARVSLANLRLMIESDPSWGVALREIAGAACAGRLSSAEVLKWLRSRKRRTR